jgi:DUF4097 and DUF4098 domain-containing protein YvlB
MRMSLLVSTTMAALAAGVVARASAHDSQQQVNADPRGTVEVSNVAGRVEVTAWDREVVSVHANLSSDSSNLEVQSDHGRTTITVRPRGMSFGPWGGGGNADLKIQIPRASELNVTAVSADVASSGVLGNQHLNTVSGSIKADIGQSVAAKTVSGDISLHGNGKTTEIHVSSISGGIHVEHGGGDVEGVTVSGDFNIQVDQGRSVRARTTSGRIAVQGSLAKGADVDAQTVSGDVKLHAVAEGGYHYELSSFSGDIRNCFNQEPEKTSRYGPGVRLNGTRGNGGVHVRIKTMSGYIDLCDK